LGYRPVVSHYCNKHHNVCHHDNNDTTIFIAYVGVSTPFNVSHIICSFPLQSSRTASTATTFWYVTTKEEDGHDLKRMRMGLGDGMGGHSSTALQSHTQTFETTTGSTIVARKNENSITSVRYHVYYVGENFVVRFGCLVPLLWMVSCFSFGIFQSCITELWCINIILQSLL
jgi:hypothetical protein